MEDDREDDKERVYKMRRMARKLAQNRSKDRTVRKLPQVMVIVKRPTHRAVPIRKAINTNKRLTYILLLGATLCAYMYDVDQNTVEQMMRTVSEVTQTHLGGLLGHT